MRDGAGKEEDQKKRLEEIHREPLRPDRDRPHNTSVIGKGFGGGGGKEEKRARGNPD